MLSFQNVCGIIILLVADAIFRIFHQFLINKLKVLSNNDFLIMYVCLSTCLSQLRPKSHSNDFVFFCSRKSVHLIVTKQKILDDRGLSVQKCCALYFFVKWPFLIFWSLLFINILLIDFYFMVENCISRPGIGLWMD